MMKVLSVNNVFIKGSTGKILDNIHTQLTALGHTSIVCYARDRGKLVQIPNVKKFCTELEGDFWHAMSLYCNHLPYGGMWFSTRKLISIIKNERPDVVNLHCINDWSVNVYELLKYLGQHQIKTIVSNHAEFFYTGFCGHAFDCLRWTNNPGCGNCPLFKSNKGQDKTAKAWRKMRDAFAFHSSDNLIFTAVSPWVKSRLLQSPITNSFDCFVVENGVDTTIYHPYNNKNCIDMPIVFHASARFNTIKDDIKGGFYIFELAKRFPFVHFKVACGTLGEIEDPPANVEMLGNISDPEVLAKLYSEANLCVIASKRETFSMITAESLCCGTPVVGFEAGGPESIALPNYSKFVKYGDIDALQYAVEKLLSSKYNPFVLAKEAKERYSANVMVQNYLEVYNTIIQK